MTAPDPVVDLYCLLDVRHDADADEIRQAVRKKRREILADLGDAQVAVGAISDAIASYRRARRLSPRAPKHLVGEAMAYLQRETCSAATEAVTLLKRARSIAGSAHPAHAYRAQRLSWRPSGRRPLLSAAAIVLPGFQRGWSNNCRVFTPNRPFPHD